MIVVDASVVVGILINGKHTAAATDLLIREQQWAAPLLIRHELQTVFATHMRLRDYDLRLALTALHDAEEIFGGRLYDVATLDVLELAQRSGCSAYDCEYVALAMDLGVPLLTLDRQLLNAFPRVARRLEVQR
jgi:predicted nucleic acid-binding protein